MKKYVFATNNAHKLEEVKDILGDKIELLSMKDINCQADIPETADTLAGNALIKARYIYDNYHLNCFADDTGLEVEALNGAPGVYSARYAGDAHNSEANMKKLLHDLEGVENRKAQFRTVFALIIDGKELPASAMTPSSCPKAIPRPLRKWAMPKRTRSATGPKLRRSSASS